MKKKPKKSSFQMPRVLGTSFQTQKDMAKIKSTKNIPKDQNFSRNCLAPLPEYRCPIASN
jgi:hypothetical protein